MGFNSVFKGLSYCVINPVPTDRHVHRLNPNVTGSCSNKNRRPCTMNSDTVTLQSAQRLYLLIHLLNQACKSSR